MLSGALRSASLEPIADAVVSMDQEGRISDFDPAAEAMFGQRREAVLGLLLADVIVAPQFRSAQRGSLDRCFAVGKTREPGRRFEFAAFRSDGTTFPIELAVARSDFDGAPAFIGFICDISARKESEQALRASEERFRLLVQSVKDYAIFMLDAEGRVATWNAGAQACKGYTPAEILGRHFSVFYPEEERIRGKPARLLEAAIELGRVEDEGWRVRKDGSEFWANVLITAIRDSSHRLVGFAKVTRDLSERRDAEDIAERTRIDDMEGRQKSEALEEENRQMHEANRLKSEFLANMSHELRSPLNAIIGFSELMFKGRAGPVSDDHREYLGDILNSSQHLLKLIDDVLDLAKVESGKMQFCPEPVDLGRIVAEVGDILRGIASNKRIDIKVNVDRSVAAAVLDPSKLKQVLYNYLSNALKFTPEEGMVTVHVTPEGGEKFRIAVEDTGIGIRREDTRRLFVEFQQLDAGMAKKYAGTGLGLALTKRIVEAQGGSVGVTSQPGSGSTFWAVLPRRANAPRGISPSTPSPPLSTAQPNPSQFVRGAEILIVDDNAANLKLARLVLQREGYAVRTAASAEEALRLISSSVPQLVLMDIQLPGMDGLQLTQLLKADPKTKSLVILALTAYAMKGDEDKACAAGCDGYITKPIDIDLLPRVIARHLSLHGAP